MKFIKTNTKMNFKTKISLVESCVLPVLSNRPYALTRRLALWLTPYNVLPCDTSTCLRQVYAGCIIAWGVPIGFNNRPSCHLYIDTERLGVCDKLFKEPGTAVADVVARYSALRAELCLAPFLIDQQCFYLTRFKEVQKR